MGIFFQDKKPVTKKPSQTQTPAQKTISMEEHFLDETFREELRNHARLYFKKVIRDNGTLFKKDLDETIGVINGELKSHVTNQLDKALAEINTDLKSYVTSQLDERFAESSAVIKQAQDAALTALEQNAKTLQEQYDQLSKTLAANVASHEKLLVSTLEENTIRINSMREAQDSALRTLSDSAEALKTEYETLKETVQKQVAEQEDRLIGAFENNMSQVVEHYVLAAVGDQFDVKSQLPSILKQLEANKQAMVDDIKL